MLEITRRFETDEQAREKHIRRESAAALSNVTKLIYFHRLPVCTVRRSLPGEAIASNGIPIPAIVNVAARAKLAVYHQSCPKVTDRTSFECRWSFSFGVTASTAAFPVFTTRMRL
jgi:hypothetical protein